MISPPFKIGDIVNCVCGCCPENMVIVKFDRERYFMNTSFMGYFPDSLLLIQHALTEEDIIKDYCID